MFGSKSHRTPILILTALVVVPLALLVLINIYIYYSLELNPESVKFFIKDKKEVPDSENISFAIIGLNAPVGINDIHEYGVKRVNKTLSKYLDTDNKHITLDVRLPEIQNELTFNADENKLGCWSERKPDRKYFKNASVCYTKEELSDALEKNTVLLKRYESLIDYKKNDSFIALLTNRSLLIKAHRLFLAQIRYRLESGNEYAINDLVSNLEHRRVILNQPGTTIDKAINLVLYGLSLDQLEYAITQYPHIALKYEKQIVTALNDLTIEEYNLEGIFREEFQLVNSIYCIDESLGIQTTEYCQPDISLDSQSAAYIMNDFYEFYLNYKDMLHLDINSLSGRCDDQSELNELELYSGVLLHLPIAKTYMSYELLKSGMTKGCELMIDHKLKAAKQRQIKVYLDIKREKLAGNDINDYLKSEAERDYLTGKPFVYDINNNNLEFPGNMPDALREQTMKMYH